MTNKEKFEGFLEELTQISDKYGVSLLTDYNGDTFLEVVDTYYEFNDLPLHDNDGMTGVQVTYGTKKEIK